MSRTVIVASGLGKQYQLGPSERLTFRESILDGARGQFVTFALENRDL